MNNDCTVFGKNLIKFRKANSMTQEQLARKMNVSPQAVSKWEKNSYPDAQLLPLLAQTLNTSLDVLFGLKEESEIDTEQLITDKIRATDPKKRSEIIMKLCYTANCAYNDYTDSKAVLPEGLELETYAELKTDNEIALARLNESLRYFCFLAIPPNGVSSYTDVSPYMVRLFEMLADEAALKIIYYLGSDLRNKLYSKDNISKKLDLPLKKVSQVIDKLDRLGIVWRMSAEISDSPVILYAYTHNTPLVFILTLAKSLTNFIKFCEPRIDKFETGAFGRDNRRDMNPIPQVSLWTSNEEE